MPFQEYHIFTRLSGDPAIDQGKLEQKRVWNRNRRRSWSIGTVVSAVVHALLIWLLFDSPIPAPTDTGALGPSGDGGPAGGGGGGGLTMIDLWPEARPVPQPTPVLEPVPPEAVVAPPPPPDETIETFVVPATAPAAPAPPSEPGTGGPGAGGPGQGGQSGQGVGTGTGSGVGPGSGTGGGGLGDGGLPPIVPPTPRGIFIPPPGRPANARGLEITVRLFVTENGRVDRSRVRLDPPTSDARYNQRLIQSVSEWVFDPARRGGRPVSVEYEFQIIL